MQQAFDDMNQQNFYKDKTVLVTGHTGFKGSWLSIWLLQMGAKVIGYGLDPVTERDNFVLVKLHDKMVDIRGDIRDREKLRCTFETYRPDIVFHLAAQPLVRLSYEQPIETWEVNVIGTLNVMAAITNCTATKVAVLITTDKCYENKEQIWGYREDEPMGGYDPYSSSKGAAEIAIASWRRSFMHPDMLEKHGKAIASARAGNVIGGGDWAKDRIIPDCIRALENNCPIEIRNPYAIRPWQHVLEPLSGYLLLGQRLWEEPTRFAEAWNFGPNSESITTVWEIAEKITVLYGKGCVKDVSTSDALHEATLLSLDISKARCRLGWTPRWNLDQTLAQTVEWYTRYTEEDVFDVCCKQIQLYQE